MNFDNFKPFPIERFGGGVAWDDPTLTPNGLANVCRNSRFRARSIATRYGRRHTMTYAAAAAITGLDVLNVIGNNAQQIPVLFTSTGLLLKEFPSGSGTVVPVTGITFVSPPAGAYMLTAMAYNNLYMSFSDLLTPSAPAVMNGNTLQTSPVSQNPVGALWTPGRRYVPGDLVRLAQSTPRWFRCSTDGVAGAVEPTWPVADGYYGPGNLWNPSLVQDPNGTSIWEEWTPGLATYAPTPEAPVVIKSLRPGQSGTIPAGRDVYVCFSYGFIGESAWTAPIVFTNTQATDILSVYFRGTFGAPGTGGPGMPKWLATLDGPGPWNGQQLNVYVADVVTGAPAPTQYGLFAANQPKYAPVTIDSVPGVQNIAPKTTSNARLSNGAPFIGESGTRYVILLRRDSNQSLSPVDPDSALPLAFESLSQAAPVVVFPTPAVNIIESLAALTVVGASAAGPYHAIEAQDPTYPAHANIVSLSRDAATGTVSAVLNKVDGILPGLVINVSSVFDMTFDGLFTVATVDASTGIVTWAQTGANAASSGGSVDVMPEGATVAPSPGHIATTGVSLSFDDNFLDNSTDVTAQLTAIPVPPCVDIFYSPSLKRMVYTLGNDSSHYFSNQDDPSNIDSPGGILGVEQTNGKKTVCFREMPNGELLSLKENGGYSVTPADLTPNKWTVGRRWAGHGPVGPMAVGMGPDWLIIFSEGIGPGRYYQGNFEPVGLEKIDTWKRVNPAVKHKIWIAVDDDAREVHIGLPLDGATEVNTDVVLNYFNGWDAPVIVTYENRLRSHYFGRRWTENDCTARCAKRVDRTITTAVDNSLLHKQLLYGMANAGATAFVDMDYPGQYHDESQTASGPGWEPTAIDWQYQPAFAASPSGEVLTWVGMKGRARGGGQLLLSPVTDDVDFKVKDLATVDLTGGKPVKYARGTPGGQGRIDSELFTVLFSNGNTVDAWAELHNAIFYADERFGSREKG